MRHRLLKLEEDWRRDAAARSGRRTSTVAQDSGGTFRQEVPASERLAGSGGTRGPTPAALSQGYAVEGEGILGQVLEGMVQQQLRGMEGRVHSGMCARAIRSLRSLPLAVAFFRWATRQPHFRPSSQCYAALFRQCGVTLLYGASSPEESRRALQWAVGDAQSRGVEWTTYMLTAAVQSCGALGRIADADAFVSDAVKGGLVLDWQVLG